VAGLGWGGGVGVAACGVEQEYACVGDDVSEIDIAKQATGWADKRGVGPVLLKPRIHAENGNDGCGSAERQGFREVDRWDSWVPGS
jgi:hypothetical protein